MNRKAIPILLAFLAMGFGDAVGPFVSLAKNEFQLSNVVASMIPLVGLGMFGVLPMPFGILQDRIGKKAVLMAGLAIALAGVLAASIGFGSFPRFLMTVLLLGAGAAVLQVAANPAMRDVSDPGTYPRNLAFGQFIKAIGSLSGPAIPVIAARLWGVGWQVIFPVYSVALLISLLSVACLRIPDAVAQDRPANLRSTLVLLTNPFVLAMVAGIFLYVGAEVSVSAGIPLFLQERFGVDINRLGLLGTGLFFTALTTGRFTGSVVLNWMSAPRFLLLSCVMGLAGLFGLFVPSVSVAVGGIFLAGLGFANIFPLIFSITIEHLPDRGNELSGLMITAIIGGAVLPPCMGWIADHTSVQVGFSVPILSILYITAIAVSRGTVKAPQLTKESLTE